MQITFIRRNWSATGGAENYLKRLATALTQHDFRCHLLCESWDGDQGPFSQITPLSVRGTRARRPALFADAVNAHLQQHEGLVFSMERGVRADIYRAGDGVHAEWLRRRHAYGGWSARLKTLCNAKHPVLLNLERVTFHPQNTRVVIANSAMVKADILFHFGYPEDQIKLIPNGVDVDYFSSGDRTRGRAAMGWQESGKIILLVGSGAERKGHLAARLVENRMRGKARLVIIDQPPPCSMPDLYAAADVFLLPTLYDPFANVTLEAMAAGLPVITTEANGAAQLLNSGKNGFVVRDAKELAEMSAYCMACLEPELAAQVGAAGRQTVMDYGLRRNVEQTVNLLQSL